MHQPDAGRKMESRFTEEKESFSSVMPVAVEAIFTAFFSPLSWIDVFQLSSAIKILSIWLRKIKMLRVAYWMVWLDSTMLVTYQNELKLEDKLS